MMIRFPNKEYAGKRVAMEFMGIDHIAKIWVNGHFASEHTGSLTSFHVDITPYVNYGDRNTVTVKVTDPEKGTRLWDSEQVIAFSGLWRDIYLEITEQTFVSDIFIVPDID